MILLACPFLSSAKADTQLSDRGAADLHTMLNVARLSALTSEGLSSFAEEADRLYAPAYHSLLWVEHRRPTAQASAVLDQLQHAENKGLLPSDYDGCLGEFCPGLMKISCGSSETEAIRFDLAMTLATIQYLSDLHLGRANPATHSFAIEIRGRTFDLASFIKEQLVVSADPRAALESVEPPFVGYRRTLAALRSYRAFLPTDGATPFVDLAMLVRPGMSYPDAPRLRTLLHLTGDLPATTNASSSTYDAELSQAVGRFQERHGLDPTGVLDGPTLQELNTPIARRIVQLELTLERWRWLPSTPWRPPVVVNIPEFRLHAIDEEHRIAISMNVVVGRAYRHETPLFESEIRSILFRPAWNVPLGIQRNELLPQLEKNPAYLAENSFDVVDAVGSRVDEPQPSEETLAKLRSGQLSLRQRPGEENSLGLVKFELPNPYDVYLHGTPAQELFSKSRRDFSHGCVRVENPVALAAWLLRENPGWNEDRILASMNGLQTLRVALVHPVPIWIVYGTAVVLEDGRVRFFRDIYGEDAALEQALSGARHETSANQ
jgi:murein L,D-transpeptidase YcbB/YkuD